VREGGGVEAEAVAETYGLGGALELTDPVARGELGEVRRFETTRGTWAVKTPLVAWTPEELRGLEASSGFQRSCWEAGVPTPEPVATSSGRYLTEVGGEQVVVHAWADLDDPDTGLEPAAVGALVARLHQVDHPWPTASVDPWFEAPIGRAEWKGVLKASRGAGAPYADRLAEVLPALVEVESILTPMSPVQTCHLDLWSDNLRRTTAGELCVIDFDNAGPADPTREVAMLLFELGQGDVARQRRLYDAYLAAGGPGRITGPADFAMTVAQLHHIGHRHLTTWPAARDPEGRARSLAGVEEFLGEPLLLAGVRKLVAAVAAS
jgi:Ser/Thr protein kinase RdoA (MazF antagonist)